MSYSGKDICRQHAHTHSRQARWALFSISLSLQLVPSTLRNSKKQKNMSCKREPIVPWREQMETPTNHWALHSAFLKKEKKPQRHKQPHFALLTHNAPPLLLHALRHSYRDVRGFTGNIAGRCSIICDSRLQSTSQESPNRTCEYPSQSLKIFSQQSLAISGAYEHVLRNCLRV